MGIHRTRSLPAGYAARGFGVGYCVMQGGKVLRDGLSWTRAAALLETLGDDCVMRLMASPIVMRANPNPKRPPPKAVP